MSRSTFLRLRLRAVSSRLCGLAIGAGLAAGLALQLAAALILTPEPAAQVTQASGHATSLMASASVAALVGAAFTGALAQRVGRHAALNAYASWAAISLVLMLQIAATTDVLSA